MQPAILIIFLSLFASSFVNALSSIELDEYTKPTIEFKPGSSVKLGWIYKHVDAKNAKNFGEFYCGYRNNDGKMFPLAIDTSGNNFLIAHVRGHVNSDRPTDSRQLLDRTVEPYVSNSGSIKRRGITLTSLQAKDAGEYYCGLYLTHPSRILYGGRVVLKISQKSVTAKNSLLIAMAITVPVLFSILGGVAFGFWYRRKCVQKTRYSLASSEEDLSASSSDDEDVVYEK